MNRRGFLTGLAAAATAFAILPSAKTYGRNWSFTKSGILSPTQEWENAPFEISFYWHELAQFSTPATELVTASNFFPKTIRYSLNNSGVFERVHA